MDVYRDGENLCVLNGQIDGLIIDCVSILSPLPPRFLPLTVMKAMMVLFCSPLPPTSSPLMRSQGSSPRQLVLTTKSSNSISLQSSHEVRTERLLHTHTT